jgi:hypothetical protein
MAILHMPAGFLAKQSILTYWQAFSADRNRLPDNIRNESEFAIL